MINIEKAEDLISNYKSNFKKHIKEERYKWDAVRCFQDNWNIDSSDFLDMLKKSFSQTKNLLDSNYYYPRRMLLEFAEADALSTRHALSALFDESVTLPERIKEFQSFAEDRRINHNLTGWKNHYQDIRTLSIYLTFKYPQKYYFYKSNIYKVAIELAGFIQPKGFSSTDKLLKYYEICDELYGIIINDSELIEMVGVEFPEDEYKNFSLHMLVQDILYYLIKIETTFEDEWYPSPQKYDPGLTIDDWTDLLNNPDVFDKHSLAVIEALYKNGSQGTCKELADKYGGNYNIYRNVSINLGKKIHKKTNCPIIKNDKGGSSWWTIPYIGKVAEKKQAGAYTWKLRDELKKAYELIYVNNKAEIDMDKSNKTNTHTKYWIYSPGYNAFLWDEFYENEIMGIGWDEIDDLKNYHSRDEMRKKLQISNDSSKSYNIDSLALWNFAYEMKPGDVVFCKKGLYTIVGCGIVTSDYYYDTSREMYKHLRKVNWTHKGEWQHPGQAVMKTLTDITKYTDYVQKLIELIEPNEDMENELYTKKHFLSQVYITEQQYDTLSELLAHKKNIILQGAPGVGKTFTAKRLAYSLMGEKDDNRIKFIQFHQSYSYEDFIMGYRPNEEGSFELREGVFYCFCDKARNDPEHDYYFIIDEINRGNLSKIFGELLMLIEKDYRSETVTLAYRDEKFSVPDNLYIIGMMNTADRSLAMIDYALRRRFSFFEMESGFDSEGFKAYSDSLNNNKFNALIAQIKLLNNEIKNDNALGKGFCIGHSYFCNLTAETCTDETLSIIIEYDIIPMLKEYWFDDKEKVKMWLANLRGIFNDD